MSRRAIAATFAAFVAIGLLWAISMPINAAPDEAQHMIWAASTARLQIEPSGPEGQETLKAPAVLFADYCFKFDPDQPADCEGLEDPAGNDQSRTVERAIPYYFVVGLPSLLTTTEATGYLMRVAHVVVTAAVLTLGVWSLSSRRPSPGSIALATVAFTPVVAFLLGTLNPSGLAIASGFAIWAGGLALVRDGSWTKGRIAAVAIPIAVFVIVRRDAVAWIVPILGVLACYVGARRIGEFVRKPVFRVVAAVAALGVVVSYFIGGDVLVRIVSNGGSGESGTLSEAFGILPRYLEQMISRLGWLDVFLPEPVIIGWYGLVIVAIVVAVGASRRDAIAVGAVVAATLLIPFLFDVLYEHRYAQGRYGLPLTIGIPVIASVALASERSRHLVNARMAQLITWTVAVMSSVAFAVALRRFTVGHRAPWPDMFLDPAWSPPLPTTVLVVAYAAVMAGVAVVLSRMITRAGYSATPR